VAELVYQVVQDKWHTLLYCIVFGPSSHSKKTRTTLVFLFLRLIKIAPKLLLSLQKKLSTCDLLDQRHNLALLETLRTFDPITGVGTMISKRGG
jgi:hypothetical protein